MENGGSDRKRKIERLAAYFGAGDLAAAEDGARQLLAADPRDGEASHLLAQIAFKSGRAEEAIALMQTALDADPMRSSYHNDYGVILASLDRLDEAAAAYEMAAVLDRNNIDARFNLALALFRAGRKARARAELDEVLAARPDLADAWALDGEWLCGEGRPAEAVESFTQAIGRGLETAKTYLGLGLALEDAHRGEEAIDALQKADEISGGDATARFHLGNVYRDKGDKTQAEHFFRRAIALRPDFAGALNNLGLLFWERGETANAAACYAEALSSNPEMSAAHVNLGNVRADEGRMESAIDSFRRATEIAPRSVEAWSNLGNAYLQLQRLEEAEAKFRRALEIQPDHAGADFNLGLLLLLRGEFSEGWAHYESRWRVPAMAGKQPKLSQPEWAGEALGPRTLLVYSEQGLGDNLQFARYLPLLRRRHPEARIYFRCVPPLHRLFEFCAPAWGIEALPPVMPGGLPPFDAQIALMSLPWRMGTTLENIPADIPYIMPPPSLVEKWAARLDPLPGRKVGVVWASGLDHAMYKFRNVCLKQLAPLFDVGGIRWVSLQKGDASGQIASEGWSDLLLDVMDEVEDFADTAAIVAHLDLVISVDTSVPHLAGAMGKPVWLLDRFNTDWRWLVGREDSPWYPTVRIFRQTSFNDWDSVLPRAAEALAEWVTQGGGDPTQTLAVPEVFAAHAIERLVPKKRDSGEETVDVLQKDGQAGGDDAADCFRLGNFYRGQGDKAQAERFFRRAVALQPDFAAAHNNLGLLLWGRGQWENAVECYAKALSIDPDMDAALVNLGDAHGHQGRLESAIDHFQRALKINPRSAEAWNSLAHIHVRQRRLDEAEAAFRRALAINPDYAHADSNLGLLLLLRGKFSEGWSRYESRWQTLVFAKVRPTTLLNQREWDGTPLRRRTLLVHSEQGLGDSLQFARYLPLLRHRHPEAKIYFWCHQLPLYRLFLSCAAAWGVEVLFHIQVSDLPPFDVRIALLSLPLRMGTTLESIPAGVPYIEPSLVLVDKWSMRLKPLPGRKVGIVWSGSETPPQSWFRNMRLKQFDPLFDVGGISWVSLQKGNAAGQIAAEGWSGLILDVMDEAEDFADTAAIVAHLDLVISVDTSVLHLAGAMGKPVWLLDRFDACWRWLVGREDSPWYPTMRIFRQTSFGDWDSVLPRVAEALAEWVAQDGGDPAQTLAVPEISLPPVAKAAPTEKKDEATPRLKLNLGCGNRKMEGFVNVDRVAMCQPDRVVDLEKTPWPWEDDSVSEIRLIHVLEHLGQQTDIFLSIIKEMYRVCRDRARIEITVPDPRSDAFLGDPTHVRPITGNVLSLFSQRLNREWAKKGGANTPLGLILGVDFEIESIASALDPVWQEKLSSGQSSEAEIAKAARQYNNVIMQSTFVWRARKPAKRARRAEGASGEFPALRQLLERSPGDYQALCQLGLEKQRQGRLEESRQCYEAAFSIAPPLFELAHNLGVVYRQLDDPVKAREPLERALTLRPDTLATLDELAWVCQKSGDLDAALACYEKALRIDPRHCRAFSGMGWAFSDAGWEEDAIRAFETALSIEPDQLEATNGLGVLYKRQGRFDRAMACFERALALYPDNTEPQYNRAMVLGALGRRDEEEAAYRKILARDPDDGDARFGLASLLLLTGRLPEGWREYESRFASRQAGLSISKPSSGLPRWRGEAVTRESSGLVIYAEQGFGDAIQFSRFVSPAARRFGRVRLQTHKPLLKLFEQSYGALAEVVSETPDERGYTHHCPLLSLPLAFGVTLKNIPADVPYLVPPPALVEKWAVRLDPLPGRKVGVVWSGSETHPQSRFRNVRLKQLEPLLDVGGIRWVSLQKEDAARQITAEGWSGLILDIMDEVGDFTDTAAVVANLDLVISVDTSVLHLAGALGKPVWLLDRFDPDWRWFTGREDSPWYPTMRIFRQTSFGDWDSVLPRVVEALTEWVAQDDGDPARTLAAAEVFAASAAQVPADSDSSGRQESAERIPGNDRERSDRTQGIKRLVACWNAGDFPAAEVIARRLLADDEQNEEALHLLAQAVFKQGRAEEAIGLMRAVLDIDPMRASYHNDHGVMLASLGRWDEAAAAYGMAVVLDRNAIDARFNLALALFRTGQKARARTELDSVLAARSDLADAWALDGELLCAEGRHVDAAGAFVRAAARDPDNGMYAALLLHEKMYLCQWEGLDDLVRRVEAAVENDTAEIPPFIVLSMPGTTPALQRRCAENQARRLAKNGEAPAQPLREKRDRLRVGYLSSDFKNHATAHLMIDMLEAHDRSRFEIFALSHGVDDASPMRARVAAAVEHFVELAGLPEHEAVSSIATLALDVLIDLKGYTEGNHSGWLRHRLAPVQINWLGYPGTLGAPWADYLIADEIVAPQAHQGMFSERLRYLPCYQPNCRERECAPSPTRAVEGLPEKALVLCSLNQTYKITPALFGLWLDVLRAVPKTVLWLLASSPGAEDVLRRRVGEAGVAPERLVFAERRPQAEHLARLALADLALDTFPCNGHTTTSDALWAGVPVVTLKGEAFAARVAASLLTTAGLEELIADTPETYLERIVRFCRNARWRKRLRKKTEALRESSDLFDGAAFARKFEALLADTVEKQGFSE